MFASVTLNSVVGNDWRADVPTMDDIEGAVSEFTDFANECITEYKKAGTMEFPFPENSSDDFIELINSTGKEIFEPKLVIQELTIGGEYGVYLTIPGEDI